MTPADRQFYADWYLRNRRRSRLLFDAVAPEVYGSRPISLRNPICFYEGHLPAFSVNTLLRRGLGVPGVNSEFEVLFERGIDPEDASQVRTRAGWPPREAILEYARLADARILDAIAHAAVDVPGDPVLDRGRAVRTICEHEEMHQETLCYMLHRLPHAAKRRPPGSPDLVIGNGAPARARALIPAGCATLGIDPDGAAFGWDNEFPSHRVEVGSFRVDVFKTTNGDFLEFVESGGYERPELWTPRAFAWVTKEGVRHPAFWERRDGRWYWRGLFEDVPLPRSWPVFVSHAEASAYARFRGARLPTEAEFHRAAFGTPDGGERPYPWGAAPPDRSRGNFDGAHWDPTPVGSYPEGASAFGVQDIVGNGWEWTSTVFAGFEGFRPMPAYPVYSADFFDGLHYVMKGASPLTARSMLRRSFRNWFRDTYPYVYAGFRCVWD